MAKKTIQCKIITTMEVFRTLLVLFFVLLVSFCGASNVVAQNSRIGAIYQFGDSISDTGNTLVEGKGYAGCGKSPYGETSFDRPTGRCSDGLLIVDYFAQAFKIPFLNPYLDKSGNFTHGVNFAVVGATALDVSFLMGRNISAYGTLSSLSVQLGWFKSHLTTICGNPLGCKKKLANALFLVGEIGGNDYNAGAFGGRSIEELRNLVPDVIQMISNVVKELIYLGARRIVVPGNFPVGCMTVYLAAFRSNDPRAYDELGCLKNWNDLASYHNTQLQHAIRTLQQQHRDVRLVYGDYFSALRSLIKHAPSLGFDKNELYKACCGNGDTRYNFDSGHICGSDGVRACQNPSGRLSWDGIHLTTHAYQYMADRLLKHIRLL